MARGITCQWRPDTRSPAVDRLSDLLAVNVDTALAVPQAHVLFRNTGVPRAAERVAEWDAKVAELCRALLEVAREDGDPRPGLDIEMTVSILLAAAVASSPRRPRGQTRRPPVMSSPGCRTRFGQGVRTRARPEATRTLRV